MPLALRVRPTRSRIVSGESVSIAVELENLGAEPVSVPRPTDPRNGTPIFTLRGPDEAADTFTLAERRKPGGRAPTLESMALVELAPGAACAETLALARVASVTAAGRYSIEARYEWAGMRAEAGPVAFEVEALRPLGPPSVGVGTGPGDSHEVFAAVLHAGEDGVALLRAGFGRTEAEHPQRPFGFARATRPAEAIEALSATTGFVRRYVFFDWTVWREPEALCALAPGAPEPLRLAIFPGTRVVSPPLLLAGHELDVLLVDGASLALARFEDPERSATGPRVLWRRMLEGAPAGAHAAPDPRERSVRHVAWLETTPARLVWARVAGTEEPASVTAWELGEEKPLPGGGPAVAVGAGVARVALALRAADDPRRANLVEGHASLDGEPRGLATVATAVLPCAVRGARVALLGTRDHAVRRAWVIEGEDGRLYAPEPRGGARVASERADLDASPLVLLPSGAFRLEAPPVGGPVLVPV